MNMLEFSTKSAQNQAMIEPTPQKTEKTCQINWNPSAIEHFEKLKCVNLLQSPAYGQAMAKQNRQTIRHGLIKINDHTAGFVQIIEAGILKNAIHAVILDRGPVWREGFGDPEDFAAFLHEFSKQFPRRFGRRLRFIPEASPQSADLLKDYGFKPVGQNYKTIWLDLRPPLETLQKNLKKNWRAELKKSENLQTHWSDDGKNFSWVMQNYEHDKAEKGYDGVSLKTMVYLAGEFSRGKNMLIGTALFDEKPIAAIVILSHGKSATYQIGYTSEQGRKTSAHHLLLWQAVEQLKERGIHDFDLGGINEDTAKGLKRFKMGMGGKITETLGLHTR